MYRHPGNDDTEAPSAAPSPRRKQILFDRLLQLDFRPQIRMFQQIIETHRVASFLIHGPPEHGQRVLAYRLARLKPEWGTGQHIVIDAGSNGVGRSMRSLWGQIARKLGFSARAMPQELIAKFIEWWQVQDIIFTFNTVDYMPSDALSDLIEEFWVPLATMADQTQHQTARRTHLLLFLVDYAGEVVHSDLPLTQHSQASQGMSSPLILPATAPFPELELEIWLDAAGDLLPFGLTARQLLAATKDGIPELVYEEICAHCGFSWSGEIARAV